MKTRRRLSRDLLAGRGRSTAAQRWRAILSLLRYDLLLLRRAVALTFAGWGDRLILVVAIGLVMLVEPPALSGKPPWHLAVGVFVAGSLIGARLAYKLLGRIERQSETGVLVAAALTLGAGVRYSLCWLAIAAVVLAGTAVWMAVPMAAVLLGLASGAGVAWLAQSRLTRSGEERTLGRAIRWNWRLTTASTPLTGVAAGVLVLAVVWTGAAIADWSGEQRSAVAALLLGGAAALLISVDNTTLRLEALVGRPVAATLRSRLGAALVATATVGIGVALGDGLRATLLPAIVATLVLAFQSLRLLLHRVHPEPPAEWRAGGTLMIGAMLAMAAPPLLLLAVPFIAVRLCRRAQRDRWLLSA